MVHQRQTARKSTGGRPPTPRINSKNQSLKAETLGKQEQPPSLRKPMYQKLPQDFDKPCDASDRLEDASSGSLVSATPTRRWTQTARKSTGRRPPLTVTTSVRKSKDPDSSADIYRADSPELSMAATNVSMASPHRQEIRRLPQTARKSTGGRPPRAKQPVIDSGPSEFYEKMMIPTTSLDDSTDLE